MPIDLVAHWVKVKMNMKLRNLSMKNDWKRLVLAFQVVWIVVSILRF